MTPGHPLNTIKITIEDFFKNYTPKNGSNPRPFDVYDNLSPVVSTKQCFDDLLTPPDHVSRAPQDTYYISENTLLRTHTSAHQSELLRKGSLAFLCSGDVYRRDSVDASHYPVFHQMEGVRVFSDSDFPADCITREARVAFVKQDLQDHLQGMITAIFGKVEVKWVDAYFPFTDPSIEMEIFFNNDWLEVLGCGVIQQRIIENSGHGDKVGWAFGLGLERLAMVLFGVPDIRLFWTEDKRFIGQFKGAAEQLKRGLPPPQFKSYSKFPPVYKDLAFWKPSTFHANDLAELVRGIAGDLVEEVVCIDKFTHPKTKKESECYRITYRSMDRNLTDEEINSLQNMVRDQAQSHLMLELR